VVVLLSVVAGSFKKEEMVETKIIDE